MKVLITPLIEELSKAIDVSFFFAEIDSKVASPRELIVHLHNSASFKQG